MHNLVTVCCQSIFEVFQVRIHNVMSLAELKERIARRYDTFPDNIIVHFQDK